MRKLFETLSLIDWITPVVSFFEDVAHGGPLNLNAWTFFIPYDRAVNTGWSQAHVEQLLSRYGVKTWGALVSFGVLSFSVTLEQAAWAEYILTVNQIPVHERSRGAPHPKLAKGNRSPDRPVAAARNGASILDDICEKYLAPPHWL